MSENTLFFNIFHYIPSRVRTREPRVLVVKLGENGAKLGSKQVN